MNILVIYYSRTGNTKFVAEEIAVNLNADIKELIDLDLLKNEKDTYWANIDLLKSYIPKKINKINN